MQRMKLMLQFQSLIGEKIRSGLNYSLFGTKQYFLTLRWIFWKRLIDYWSSYGMDGESAKTRTFGNDIPNANNVIENSLPANIVITY